MNEHAIKLREQRLQSLQEYMKIDKQALDQEIKEAQETMNIYKNYLHQLKKIKNYQEEIKDQNVPMKMQNEMVNIMARLPIDSFREAEVIYYMLQLKTDHEIGSMMNISEKTVKFHKTNVFKKTGYSSSKELVREYLGLGKTSYKNELPTGGAL
jgi:DNA-binding CsgD family transcriptional regulator